jgi:hypothetical protein
MATPIGVRASTGQAIPRASLDYRADRARWRQVGSVPAEFLAVFAQRRAVAQQDSATRTDRLKTTKAGQSGSLCDTDHRPRARSYGTSMSRTTTKKRAGRSTSDDRAYPRAVPPGVHMAVAMALARQTTLPVLGLDHRAIGDSTRIIEALERRWPDPPLYPAEAELRERALELDEYFDEELGPEIRRVFLYRLFADPALRSRPQTATRVRSGGRSCVPLSAW